MCCRLSSCFFSLFFVIYLLWKGFVIASDEGWDLFEEESINRHTSSSTEGLLNSIIGHHVSAISGEFVDIATDCHLSGPEALMLQRSYSSHPSIGIFGFEALPIHPLTIEHGSKYCAWQFNHLTTLHLQIDLTKQTARHTEASAFVPHASFSQMLHRGRVRVNEGEFKRPDCSLPLLHQKGVTNCSSGSISGRTNPKNVIARFNSQYKTCEVEFGSGSKRYYEGHTKDKSEKIGTWKFTPKYEEKPNGCYFVYQKNHVSVFNAWKTTEFSSLKFNWVSDTDLQIETSHTQPLLYHYQQFKVKKTRANDLKKRYYLSSVHRPDQPDEWFEYTPDGKKESWLLARKSYPNHRFLEIEYYAPGDKPGKSLKTAILDTLDPRLNRVKCLKAPVGNDATAIITHRFFYDLNFRINQKKNTVKTWEGVTTVYDALDRKTTYFYNKYHRLEKLIQYVKDKPYLQTTYLWKDEACELQILDDVFTFYSKDQGNLMGKIIQDGKGNILTGRFFSYDAKGNILNEKFYGNLTGISQKAIRLEDGYRPAENGSEFYERTFVYSSDSFNLLLEEKEQNGRKIQYAYVPNCDLIASKLLYDHEKICAREFYEYDENNAITTHISDNGTKAKKEDLNGVTERHITRYKTRKTIPVGLPEIIEECYLDLPTGKENLLKRIEQIFSKEGRIVEKKIFNAKGEHCYTLSWEYDTHGNVIKEIDALQHVIHRKYDENDNLIFEQGPCSDFYTVHAYDFSNRRISTEEIHTNGARFASHYRYDLVGNCIAKRDRCGNETIYAYDDLNRMIQISYPEVKGDSAAIKKSYDCMGNVIEEINERGYATKRTYNARGKITSVMYPDGQVERYEYALDGTLAKRVASNGTTTSFKVDCFGRILSEECHSEEGNLLYVLHHTYDSLHKTSSTDAMGLTTSFYYDPAGRLNKTVCKDKIVEFVYDALGRKSKKIEVFDFQQVKISCREFDYLDRVIEERIEDADGKVLKKVSYQYDALGNRTHVLEHTHAGNCQHATLYNSDKKPIKTVDPSGNETHITYNYSYRNSLNQLVLQATTTDPLGNQTIMTNDALERPVSVKKLDALGILLAHQEFFYDSQGNVVKMLNHSIMQGEKIRTIETAMAYQEMGQISLLILAKGLPEQQITKYVYDKYGQKEVLEKGDGIQIHYRYDPLGRLSSYYSSDGSLSYEYAYDYCSRPTAVKDLVGNTTSLFEYDARGRLATETLATGISISYEYDLLDRVVSLLLPDANKIVYRYDAMNLTQIDRMKHDNLLYAYRYDAFDLSGLNLKATSIHQQDIFYSYDLHKRPTEIKTSSCKYYEAQYDYVGRLQAYAQQDAVGLLQNRYTFDACGHLNHEERCHNHTYSCDSLHNRVSKDQKVFESNGLHQLIHNGEHTFTYDLAGNLVRKQNAKESTSYRYDAADRLISIKSDRDIIYQYDAFHRRIAKTEGKKTTRYLYVGQDEIGAIDEEGRLQELRILGQGNGAEIGASIAIELKGKAYAPMHDFRGNIIALLDSSGKAVETYRYSAFGETLIYNAHGQEIPATLIKNPWRFSSKRYDEESGLVFFGRRFYDPANGRWMTTDPAGLGDGPNLYAYLHHCPAVSFDLYGLQEETAQGEQAPYYPLQHVDFDDHADHSQSVEDALPNETPLGFMEKKAGKKNRMYWCGFAQIAEMGMGFMNGIMNKLKDAYEGAKALSEMAGDHYVTFVYNESHGFLYDVIRSACELFFYMNTKSVKALQNKWDAFFNYSGPNAYYYHECHSEGAIITRNALMSYPEELRKRIIVAAFAPAAYIDEKYAYQVTHYRSTRDIVPLIDFVGAFRCRDTTVVLSPHPDAPWFDHSIHSPTYADYRRQHIDNYCQKYGGAVCAQPALSF